MSTWAAQTRLDRLFKKKKKGWHEVGVSERWMWEELGRSKLDMGGAREGSRGCGRG